MSANSPSSAAATVAQKRRYRPRMPRPRAQKWFREYHSGKSQHRIARDDGVDQSSVSKAIQRCAAYIAKMGAALPQADPAGQLHLANVTEALELEALRTEAEELSRRAEVPYPGRRTIIRRKDQPDEERIVYHQEPPRIGFLRERRMLTTALWQARRAAQEAEQRPEAAEMEFAPSPGLDAAEAYDERRQKRWDAIDRRDRTCANKRTKEQSASREERSTYWRHQALGVVQGLAYDQRQSFVQRLIELDELALRAAAMEEARMPSAECRVGEGECGGKGVGEHADAISPAPPHSHTPAPSPDDSPDAACDVLHYLEALLILDHGYSREACEQIMAHFDQASGRFDWTRSARQDLRWLTEDTDAAEERASAADPHPIVPAQEAHWWGLTPEEACGPADGIHSELSPPPPDGPPDAPPIRFVTGPPAALDPVLRQSSIDGPFDKQVVLLRLNGSVLRGLHLHDVPNDQQSVIIWELVEEVLRGEAAAGASAGVGEGGSGSGGEEQVDNPSPPHPLSLSPPPSVSPSLPPSIPVASPLLTPELRQRLFEQLLPEGVAVLAPDGRVYAGRSLRECGLLQRGILFLRELCHSTPRWGESHWDLFKPTPRPCGAGGDP